MPFFEFDNHKIYFDIIGNGEPLLLLHGNSVSSKMFASEIEFYSQNYKVITFDYLGLGNSDRIDYFRDDYWNYNAKQAEALLAYLNIEQVNIIGTSGGALTGLNLCILNPNLVSKIIADSFMGEGLNRKESQSIARRRKAAKSKLLERAFWKYMNGDDWEIVVDQDIDLMERCGTKSLKTILGDFKKISAEVLCVASRADELIDNIADKIEKVALQIPNAKCVFFDFGKHPFMITQKNEFRELATDFLADR